MNIISLFDLLRSKTDSKRLKDLADADELRKIAHKSKKSTNLKKRKG
jgi:hypothetical protein